MNLKTHQKSRPISLFPVQALGHSAVTNCQKLVLPFSYRKSIEKNTLDSAEDCESP